MKQELRLSGSGGQGLILAGIILAEAAISYGYDAIQSQSYGPEARGGASKAEVIISDSPIFFPKTTNPDILLTLSESAYHKFVPLQSKESIIIVDDMITKETVLPSNAKSFPIIHTARETIGKGMVANIVAVGVLSRYIKDIPRNELLQAILNRVPRGTEELNQKAFEEGEKLVPTNN